MSANESVRAHGTAPAPGPTPACYCGHCGEPLTAPHERCEARLEFEPPRYCPECRRRLIVQVLPAGYLARCSVHGQPASGTASRSSGSA